MNKNEIETVLRELHIISGFRVSLRDVNFEEIMAYPTEKLAFCDYLQKQVPGEFERCRNCDIEHSKLAFSKGEAIVYQCRHGLVEAIAPLYSFGAHTGFLMIGQVRRAGDSKESFARRLVQLGCDSDEALARCESIPEISEDMIKSYLHIMTVCAQYLTLSSSVTTEKPTIGQLTMRYISKHFTERITVKEVCSALGYSKSTVLSAFKREFGTTVNTYLNNMRLAQAKRLLSEDDMTINEIALCSGFADQSYFSKVFSAKYEMTPSEYRKEGEK